MSAAVPLRKPRPVPVDVQDGQGALIAGLLAIDTLDRGSALIDRAAACVAWCSPRFIAAIGTDASGESLDHLDERLPGLAARSADGPQAWPISRPGAPTLIAQWLTMSTTQAVLRLRDDASSHQATQRHLADREKLLFTSRVVSVGEMASTLAHELNQPIGAVTNVLRGIGARLAAPDIDRAMLGRGVQLALEQAQYAARIITRIREYTLSRQPRRETIDLARVVRDSVALLDWELERQQVALDVQLTDDACPLVGDEVMLQQLLVNLLRNGLEAMAEAPAGQRRIAVRLERKGHEAEIALRDTGCGLPEDANARLFVPFQSTKPNGMGIGLNICRSFVELHRGRLWFSRPADGAGSIFHISLPLELSTEET